MSKIASFAASCIGTMTGKYDCSGFTQYCYKSNGINIPRTSYDQFSNGIKSNGGAGDIVCWNGHVGICDGNGNVIHSYNSNHNIRRDPISSVSRWDNRTVLGYVKFK